MLEGLLPLLIDMALIVLHHGIEAVARVGAPVSKLLGCLLHGRGSIELRRRLLGHRGLQKGYLMLERGVGLLWLLHYLWLGWSPLDHIRSLRGRYVIPNHWLRLSIAYGTLLKEGLKRVRLVPRDLHLILLGSFVSCSTEFVHEVLIVGKS